MRKNHTRITSFSVLFGHCVPLVSVLLLVGHCVRLVSLLFPSCLPSCLSSCWSLCPPCLPSVSLCLRSCLPSCWSLCPPCLPSVSFCLPSVPFCFLFLYLALSCCVRLGLALGCCVHLCLAILVGPKTFARNPRQKWSWLSKKISVLFGTRNLWRLPAAISMVIFPRVGGGRGP